MENIPAKDTSAHIKDSEANPEHPKQWRDLFSIAYGVWSSKGVPVLRNQYWHLCRGSRNLSTCGIVVANDTAGSLARQPLIRESLPDWQPGSLDDREEYFTFTYKAGTGWFWFDMVSIHSVVIFTTFPTKSCS